MSEESAALYKPRTFGKRGKARARTRAATVAFGRRRHALSLPLSLQRERLWDVYSGLRALIEDPAFSDAKQVLEFHEHPSPRLRLGTATVIWIDPQTGGFVAEEASDATQHVFRTVDLDRLTEFALAQLAKDSEDLSSSACLQTVSSLTGRTLAELEHVFILATLRRCQGNRTHTAKMLGISLRTLRNRLREQRMT